MVKNYEKAREAALHLLDVQDRTCAELVRRLVKKGFSEDTSEEVVKRLAESGLVDDRRYATLYIRAKTEAGKGSRWISQKLTEKGLASSVIKEAFDEIEEADECENEEIRCLRKALSICGLAEKFDIDSSGELYPSELYLSYEENAGDKIIDWYGRRIPQGETDRLQIRKVREREKASLIRRLISAGFPSTAAFSAAGKIGKL